MSSCAIFVNIHAFEVNRVRIIQRRTGHSTFEEQCDNDRDEAAYSKLMKTSNMPWIRPAIYPHP